jgi:poly(hydroxyalkanoate) depolymerase family esterase
MALNRTTVEQRARLRNRWKTAGGRPSGPSGKPSPRSPLAEIAEFGANPGALRMLAYAPDKLAAASPLVVVLHGCTQNARGYDAAAGWTALADELGFAVLYPEQRMANNPNGCFNWFLAADKSRGLGETRSIREMIETMTKRHRIDRGRIFVTGLSAGGAMAAALLADYPELFSAGAVIAGLPCGVAASVKEAFEAMGRPAERTPEQLGDLVRSNSDHEGLWPRVAVWHGTADATVAPRNADLLVRQWLNVHGAQEHGAREDVSGGHRRKVWSVDGRDVVELTLVAGMGHGAPLDVRQGEKTAPFMLEVGLSSTRRIASFFSLDAAVKADAGPRARDSAGRAPALVPDEILPPSHASAGPDFGADTRGPERRGGRDAPGRVDIGETIAKALKAAGLMR